MIQESMDTESRDKRTRRLPACKCSCFLEEAAELGNTWADAIWIQTQHQSESESESESLMNFVKITNK